MRTANPRSFDEWRSAAGALLNQQVPPADILWGEAEQPSLFADDNSPPPVADSPAPSRSANATTPREFIELATSVACHRNPRRWELLYRTLWRLTHGEKELLRITVDDDIHRLLRMRKEIRRDAHKMKAFVRFRKLDDAGAEQYIAWHRPDHRIVRLVAPFFARRFKGMNWSILTPDESAHWDRQELQFGPGVPASAAPQDDALEELWRTYYASIFNPARVSVATMTREMPRRHWPTLPETTLIPDLLAAAASRVESMIETQEGFARTAASFLPAERDWASLAAAARECTACDLCRPATQTVFGAGPIDARIMLVGEQPGDREDLAGRPFVGPAGELLDQTLVGLGLSRNELYVTNVVKHFKFVPRSKQRLHQKPDSREIAACRPWLEAELELVRPQVLVCLGATAAQALLGRDFRITSQRGQVQAFQWCRLTIATWHPAVLLRMPDAKRREQMRQEFATDLTLARLLVGSS